MYCTAPPMTRNPNTKAPNTMLLGWPVQESDVSDVRNKKTRKRTRHVHNPRTDRNEVQRKHQVGGGGDDRQARQRGVPRREVAPQLDFAHARRKHKQGDCHKNKHDDDGVPSDPLPDDDLLRRDAGLSVKVMADFGADLRVVATTRVRRGAEQMTRRARTTRRDVPTRSFCTRCWPQGT